MTASSFAQSSLWAKAGRGRIANSEAFAIGRDPIAIGHAHAGACAVPGEDHIMIEIDAREIGDLAIRRLQDADIGQLQMLDDIRGPDLTESFPGEHINAARTSRDHNANSIAPVSEPGTIATR